MAEFFSRSVLKIAVAQICQGLGWHAVQTTPCEILMDVVERYIRQLAQYTHRYSEQYGKTDPTLEDLGLALHDMGFSISELNTYLKEVEPIPFAKAVPCFPIPKSSNFQHPLPGSKHCRERLHYIPEYLPPLVSIKGEADTSDLAELSDISHSTSANGIHHEGTDSNLKSPRGLGSSFETPPRPEKRSLQSPFDGHDTKRMRRVEDGTPQELVTVTMEANGILTPKREGKLPDACTPPPKFIDKPKQKSTTSPSLLAEPLKLKGNSDIKKLNSKELSSKKPVKEIESKKLVAKPDVKKSKDNIESKKSNENNDPAKTNKLLKTNTAKKSPRPAQTMSPIVTANKPKTSQKSPKRSFSLFSSESSFKYPTKQKSLDKSDFTNTSKSPKQAPTSPLVLQTKKSDLQSPPVKSQPKKSDIYDFDDDEFDSPLKDKDDVKLLSPTIDSSLSAMQEAVRSVVAKGRQEMEAGKAKLSSTQSSSESDSGPGSKLDSSPLSPNNPTDAAISAVIKKKQKTNSLEKTKEAYLPPKFAFKQALREEEAELKKKTIKSSNKKMKKIKKDKAKDVLHTVKDPVIKKQKKIKEKKLKIASDILDKAKTTKKPDFTFKVKVSGGETKIVKESKEDSKLAPIPKLNIKRKNSTSLQVVQVKPDVVHAKKDEKKKEKKDKVKLKKKKLKLKASEDDKMDVDKNVTKKPKSVEPPLPKITLTFGSSSTGEGSKRLYSVIKPIKPPSPVKKSPSPILEPLSPESPSPDPPSPEPPVLTPMNFTPASPAKTSTVKKKKTGKPLSPLQIPTPARPVTPTTKSSPTSKSPPIEIKLDSKIFSTYDFDSDSSSHSLETPRTPTTSPTPLFPKPDISPTYKRPASPPYKPSASPSYKYAVSPTYKSPVSPTYKPDSPVGSKSFDLPPVKSKETKSLKKSNQNKKSTAEKMVKKSASPSKGSAAKNTPERKPGTKVKSSPKTSPSSLARDKQPEPASVTPPPFKTETSKANKSSAQSTSKTASKVKTPKATSKGLTKAQSKSQKLEETKAQKSEEAKVKKAEERSVVTETIGTVVAETEDKIWICPTCNIPDDGSPMIGCDNCDDWYHWPCVKITKAPPESQDWYCPRCRKKKRKKKKF